MKKFNKYISRVLCALLCMCLLAGCGGKNGGGNTEAKKCSIGVALYQDAGPAVTALKAYLEEAGKVLNCTFKYVVLSSNDEAVNLTKIQELIASKVDGIICTMDMGMPAIIEECEAAGVYLGGYLADFDTSYTQNYDKVFKSTYFVGNVADGKVASDITTGYDFFESLKEYNEAHPDAPVLHVSMTSFPFFVFKTHETAVKQFIEAADKYNATAAKPITVDPFNQETDMLMFAPVDSTYFAKHPGIDGIVSFCAGKFVYGTMVSAGVADKIKLFSAGYEDGDYKNFGTAGTGTYQQEIVCAVESVNYPLVLLINKINGVSFKDQPEVAERQNAAQMVMNSDEDMAAFQKSLYLTGKTSDALFSAQDIYNMTALNPDATYAALVESLKHLTIEDVIAKKK